MAERKFCCFKGRGEISLVDYLARLARTAGFIPVGNAPSFVLNATETTENIKDFTTPGGGTACAFREIDAVTVALQLRCHSPRNWSIATGGSGEGAEVATAAVASEEHVLWPGTVEPLDHLADDTVAIVVKSADGQTTYDVGTDYEITPAGSIKLVEGTTIPAPTVAQGKGQPNITVSYTRREQRLIQLYSQPPKPVALHFDGYNVAESPVQPIHFDLFKVVFGPAASVNVISDNLAQLELTGTVERDATRPMGTLSNPFSQYGTLKI
ncbi:MULTISPECIES: hypothetical protein [Comamonas]|uniref:phage tail tube protein n=1 Tax=Comamonas TaxID=283 RepID=UPI0001DA68D4|nr:MULTISPECIES: hypothetical protein [Comamonas]EFI60750.1 hypothetical protein CTS44_15048 [Comamonas thiooxydans]TFF63116.1 hypothetical protein EIC84_03465 [Comamonas sp. A23]